jgi:hypothetical protein
MARVRKQNAFAVIISALVIALLILAGPAQGFTLALGLNNNNPEKGDSIKFTVELDIEAGERLPIDHITLFLDGPQDRACQFDSEGNILAGCDGMTISRVSYPSYTYGYGYGYHPASFGYGYFGYGYGYGPGKLAYEITLDTSDLPTGSYKTNFQVKIQNENTSQNGPSFVVKSASSDDDDDEEDDDKPNGSCITSWVCTDWSPCNNGQQTRSCQKDIAYCYAGQLPELSRSCSDFVDLSGSNNDDRTVTLTNTSNTSNASTFASRITGAVVGLGNTEEFNEDSLLFLVAVMVLVLALLTLLLLIRRGRIAKIRRQQFQQRSFY